MVAHSGLPHVSRTPTWPWDRQPPFRPGTGYPPASAMGNTDIVVPISMLDIDAWPSRVSCSGTRHRSYVLYRVDSGEVNTTTAHQIMSPYGALACREGTCEALYPQIQEAMGIRGGVLVEFNRFDASPARGTPPAYSGCDGGISPLEGSGCQRRRCYCLLVHRWAPRTISV